MKKEITSPRKAIPERCLDCRCGDSTEVYRCDDEECSLWERRYTQGTKKRKSGKSYSALKSIRLYCLDCCCGSSNEVHLCPVEKCPLYDFRFGKNPYLTLTEEDRQKKINALANYREKIKNQKSDT